MADEIKNYENIDIPYNTFLSRGEITNPEGSLDSSNGTKEEEIKSGDSLNDIWIRNFIKSENFSPKKRGFMINGLTGYAEFSNVYISGNIEALTGTIGGFTIGATSLSAVSGGNTTTLSSGATAFSAGPTGSPTVTITQAGGLTATSGTIGGTTITSTALTGGIIRTAGTGARIELLASTTRLNAINSTGTVLAVNNGDTVGVGILKITPIGTASRGIEFVIPATLASPCITIDNPSTSTCIDMTDAGSTGINIAGASAYGINISSHAGTNASLNVSGGTNAASIAVSGGDYPAIDLIQNGASTNSFGIRISQDTNAVKAGILIDDNANSHVSQGMYIDRDLAADNQIGVALRIDCTNTGIGGKACGIDFTGATIQAIMNVAADATDPTGGGGAALGRIPIYVAGVLRYLAYYT